MAETAGRRRVCASSPDACMRSAAHFLRALLWNQTLLLEMPARFLRRCKLPSPLNPSPTFRERRAPIVDPARSLLAGGLPVLAAAAL
ncbi:hypothetical protein MRX96_058288 [Rhipicephalus microplus]